MIKEDVSQEDLIEFGSSWVKRAISALIAASDFQANANWISEKLNISMEHAEESFNWLLQKNFIQKTEFGFRIPDELLTITEPQLSRSQLFDLYRKIRNDLTSKLVATNIHRVSFLLTDQELVKDFLKKYDALIEATYKAGLTKGCTNVIAIDLAIPRLTAPKTTTQTNLQDSLFQAAHDIKGPLTALNLISNSLSSNSLDENLANFLKETVSNINTIASDILNIKKEFRLHHLNTATDLIEINSFDKELSLNLVTEKRIKINFQSSSNREPQYIVSGNVNHLRRIIKNFIQNSIDANADSVTYERTIENSWVVLKIKDDGPGFPSDLINILGREGITTKTEGNGIALYYAAQTIAKWDGEISFYQLNPGACIEIKLKILNNG